MNLLTLKIIFAAIILGITLLGGLWPFFKKAQQTQHKIDIDFPFGESVATGIFLGAGLIHMLPDAADAFNQAGYQYPFAFLIAALSFLFLLFLEHLSHSFKHHSQHAISSMALLTALMLSVHSLLEGAAVGLANNFLTSFFIFIAIAAHKGAESFALAVNLNRSALSRFCLRSTFLIFICMTPLGIFAGSWVAASSASHGLLFPIFSSLAAGTFLYIGTLHGLDRANLIRHCCNLREFLAMLLGFSLMTIIAIWA